MRAPHRLASAVLLALLAACAVTPASLERMYASSVRERSGSPFAGLGDDYLERMSARRETVRGFLDAGSLETAEQHLYAAAILVSSDDEADLVLARDTALRAAELGETRGFRVAAEAIDKLAMQSGTPQRYGTQYYYEEVLSRWRLYPVDPNTTDTERQAMGVEPMAALLEREAQLNESVR
ncbi:MAG: hypothetical protein H6828_06415 [Planctomycetes bacterium]|nr:hypothetical protein [Planctomycetota bacterium]